MMADKVKKAKLTHRAPEKSDADEDADHGDGELVFSIEKLQDTQDLLEKVNEEASEKVLEVEQKYNEKRRPIYLKRNEIIKAIPDFWLTAFLSHPALGDLLSGEDQEIFKFLNSLDVEDFKDVKSGYAIRLNFDKNPYFEDTTLTKTFTFFDDGTTKIVGTAIKWNEGMGVANGAKQVKGDKRPPSEESFFSWFSAEQKDTAEFQDDVAEIIKEDLWPNPLKYFNTEADEESEGDEEENADADDNDGEKDTVGDS